jgi:hypothetical protein
MQFSNGIQMYLWQYYIKRKRVIKISIKQKKIDQSYDNNAFMRWPFIKYPVLMNIHYYSISTTWPRIHIIAYRCRQKTINFCYWFSLIIEKNQDDCTCFFVIVFLHTLYKVERNWKQSFVEIKHEYYFYLFFVISFIIFLFLFWNFRKCKFSFYYFMIYLYINNNKNSNAVYMIIRLTGIYSVLYRLFK